MKRRDGKGEGKGGEEGEDEGEEGIVEVVKKKSKVDEKSGEGEVGREG